VTGWNWPTAGTAPIYILCVFVPQYQNLGIGNKLIGIVETTLQKMNFSRVTLNVSRSNQNAIRLYTRLGFQIVAEEPGSGLTPITAESGTRFRIPPGVWKNNSKFQFLKLYLTLTPTFFMLS